LRRPQVSRIISLLMKPIPSLNGLRALSILLVLISHAEMQNFHIAKSKGGQIGVTIFFVISGFLITHLLMNEEKKNGRVSLRLFYIRRAIRIFPVYYIFLVVCIALASFNFFYISETSLLSSITYTKCFFKSEWETGHLWSLSVEEFFYLIWPIAFIYLKNYRVLFALAVICVIPCIRLLSDLSPMNIFMRADSIMWGCLFALYYERILAFLKSIPKIFLLTPFFVICCSVLIGDLTYRLNMPMPGSLRLALFGSFGTVTSLATCLIIVVSINFENNPWFKLLNLKLVSSLGILSYSIYIWQQLFFSPNLDAISTFPMNIVLIFIVANISYYLIEKPFLKLKSRLNYPSTNKRGTVQPIPVSDQRSLRRPRQVEAG